MPTHVLPNFDFLAGPSDVAARRLLGCHLVRELPGKDSQLSVRLVGRIVETEAYDQHDAASHSFKGRTPRTDIMFGPPGHLYVYFTYGMHYCCNVVTGPEGQGAAVLIRAVEPLEGLEIMSENRSHRGKIITGPALTNGPAKLCQAFDIDKALNGHDLSQPPLTLLLQPEIPADEIVQTTRIGISQATDAPLRFFVKDNQYVYC